MQNGTTTPDANEWLQYAAANAHERLDCADARHDDAAALRGRRAYDGKIFAFNNKILSCTLAGAYDEHATTTLRSAATTSNGTSAEHATHATTTAATERTRHYVQSILQVILLL